MLGSLERLVGRILLGKKTIVEFSASEIVIYNNGYGMSIPKRFPRTLSDPVRADVPEREKDVGKYEVRLHVANNPGIVAEAEEKNFASSFSNAIMVADEKFRQLKQEMRQSREEEDDIPE
jgi:hypothetical protein